MSEPDLSLELQAMANAMVNSVRLLYKAHSYEFKLAAFALIAILAYWLGRSTATDPLDNDVKNMNQSLKNRNLYTIYLPKKIKSIARTKKVILGFLLILSLAAGSLYYLNHQLMMSRTHIQLQIAGLVVSILFLLVVGMWLYQCFLNFSIKRGSFNDQIIHQKLAKILGSLGKKTELLIKGSLCRQKYLGRKKLPVGVCSKANCKEYRNLLKQRAEEIAKMTDNVINFEWCSICSKKVPYDQFLGFQSKIYVKNENSKEEEEVSQRNQYLLSEMERMVKWVQEISPCNCSKRYWIGSTKEIIEFKKQDKVLSQQLSLRQSSRKSIK